ncbi:hypothetical protein KKA02_00265 [Patescibacteria group bacterium]|nr:hypothetical protein [Patescibacteria group bacterium]
MDKKTILLIFMAFLLGASLVFAFQQNTNREQKELTDSTIVTSPASLIDPTVVPIIQHNPTSFTDPSITPATSTLVPTSTPDPFSTWTIYTNNTLKYRFLYNPAWNLTTQANTVSVQGDISTKGWPSINVSKLTISASDVTQLKTKVENLFSTPTTQVSIGTGIQAILLERAASPQAYAGQDYYFLHQGNTLVISLNDTGHTQGDQLYQHFLSNFELY